MNTVIFNGESYTKKQLFNLGGKDLVGLYNALAKKLKRTETKRFSTINAGVERTWALLEEAGEGKAPSSAPSASLGTPTNGKAATKRAPKAAEKVEKAPKAATPKRRAEDQAPRARRGTNLAAPGFDPIACREGSKQAILVDCLAGSRGATMPELIKALSGGNKPWTEATVRSGFGWDMKQKGYGVRSEFDADGTERFFIVLPTGKSIPRHTALKGKPKAKG
jgi:pyruvate/2-oxoglutarate dehydrogenase complex dihydrolipoamide acyltransferase (E2) component